MSFLKPHAAPSPSEPTQAHEATTVAVRYAPHDASVQTSLHALEALAEARARAERVLGSELQRMEDSFIVTLKSLEDRLAIQQQEMTELQRKYDQLLKNQLANDRNLQTLRELKRVLESI